MATNTKAVAPASTKAGDFMTCKEASAILKITEISVRRMLTLKQLKRYKVGSRTLVRASEVCALIREV